jgi:hypothetical protein
MSTPVVVAADDDDHLMTARLELLVDKALQLSILKIDIFKIKLYIGEPLWLITMIK